MSKKVNLGGALGGLNMEPLPPRPDELPPQAPPPDRRRPNAPAAAPEPPRPDSEVLPLYQRLIRKDARLREDQVDALADLARRIGRTNRKAGIPVEERITENTLIRVAVDLLLADARPIAGTSEREIRASLGINTAD